jgi:hypothetical protein
MIGLSPIQSFLRLRTCLLHKVQIWKTDEDNFVASRPHLPALQTLTDCSMVLDVVASCLSTPPEVKSQVLIFGVIFSRDDSLMQAQEHGSISGERAHRLCRWCAILIKNLSPLDERRGERSSSDPYEHTYHSFNVVPFSCALYSFLNS